MTTDTKTSRESALPRSDGETLIDWLRDRDAPCPLCQYNLRGLTSPRCPECGQMLQLSVGLAEPYLKAWIALMAAVCAGAGFGIFLVCLIILQGWPRGERVQMYAGITLQILMIPAAAVILISRRRFQRLSLLSQRLLVLVGTGLVLVAYTLFFSGIR